MVSANGKSAVTEQGAEKVMRVDRRVIWVLLIVCLILLLWLALDHILFPDLPTPADVPPISK